MPDSFTDDAEAAWHRRISEEVFGLHFDAVAKVQAERNVLLLSSKELAFAQRLDCRTYFIERLQYGHDRRAGVFRGSDEEQLAVARDIFRRLSLSEEVAKE